MNTNLSPVSSRSRQLSVESEATLLVSQISQAYNQAIAFSMDHMHKSAEEAHAAARRPLGAPQVERLMSASKHDPTQISWSNLNQLCATDPNLSVQAWLGVREAARAQVQSGAYTRSALAPLNGGEPTPLQQSVQVAIREELASAFAPRNGLEWSLIDQMTNFTVLMTHYTLQLTEDAQWAESTTLTSKKKRGQLPLATQLQANEAAAQMIERFQRMYLRSLRALRDLQRCPNPSTVNVNGHNVAVQVNMPEDR